MANRDAREVAAIFGGGAVGGLLRTGLSEAFPTGAGSWPWATLAINLAGAFALGYFATRLQERLPLSAYRRPLLGTGLCGAFTTFSTVQIELLELLDAHRYTMAAGYAAVTIVAGYFAIVLATALVRRTRVLA
jgi:CrcB protein